MTRPATALAREFERSLRLGGIPAVEVARGRCERCGDGRLRPARRWSMTRWEPLSPQARRTAPHLGAVVLSRRLCAACWIKLGAQS